jgi:hypothetical protein
MKCFVAAPKQAASATTQERERRRLLHCRPYGEQTFANGSEPIVLLADNFSPVSS